MAPALRCCQVAERPPCNKQVCEVQQVLCRMGHDAPGGVADFTGESRVGGGVTHESILEKVTFGSLLFLK